MGCPEAGDEAEASQICDISCAREYSAAIALAILIAAICFKQTEKISLGPGVCGPVLGGGCLSWRASSPVWEGSLWVGSPLVGGVWGSSDARAANMHATVGCKLTG